MMILFAVFSASFDETWCNPPHMQFVDVAGADLIQVQVITRHGARTPLHISNNYNQIWMCNNTEFVLNRVYEANPAKVHVSYGKSLFGGECHFGQLVAPGEIALKTLGEHFSRIYIKHMKFLPNEMIPSLMSFRSTSTHRTIHSAMAFINGMYPNHTEIAIDVADKDFDPWRRSSLVCPNLKKRIDSLKESPEFISQYGAAEEQTEIASKATGVKTKAAPDVYMASRCAGLHRPNTEADNILDKEALRKARQQEKVFSDENIFPLAFSFPISEIINCAAARISGESQTRFKLWSGHNGNILGLLGYLGLPIKILPPFGSYFVFEFWKNSSSKEIFVRMNYNGKYVSIPRLNSKEHVPFSDFYAFVQAHMPSLYQECGFKPEKLKESTVQKIDDK